MSIMKWVVGVFCALTFAGTALADDFMPPSWRGTDGSLTAEWEFTDNSNPCSPDGALTNMNGASGTRATEVHSYSADWRNGDGDGEWYWDSGRDSIIIYMDNVSTTDPNMQILIQVTGSWTSAPEMVFVRGYDYTDGWDLDGKVDAFGANATQAWWLCSLSNTDYEQIGINIANGSTLDQVVVDTAVATPEPSVIALLAVGGAALLRRRNMARR